MLCGQAAYQQLRHCPDAYAILPTRPVNREQSRNDPRPVLSEGSADPAVPPDWSEGAESHRRSSGVSSGSGLLFHHRSPAAGQPP